MTKQTTAFDSPDSAPSPEEDEAPSSIVQVVRPQPKVLTLVTNSQIQQARLNAGVKARAARDAFRQVVQYSIGNDPEAADAVLSQAKESLLELWAYIELRAQAFRSLLAMLDAALRLKSVRDFSQTQLECLTSAFETLPKNSIDPSEITNHIKAFAKARIDITDPIRPRPKTKISIKIERE